MAKPMSIMGFAMFTCFIKNAIEQRFVYDMQKLYNTKEVERNVSFRQAKRRKK